MSFTFTFKDFLILVLANILMLVMGLIGIFDLILFVKETNRAN